MSTRRRAMGAWKLDADASRKCKPAPRPDTPCIPPPRAPDWPGPNVFHMGGRQSLRRDVAPRSFRKWRLKHGDQERFYRRRVEDLAGEPALGGLCDYRRRSHRLLYD